MIKNQDKFVSGEQLSEKLKISRAAVKKIVGKLLKLGYVIEAKTGLGYRLISLPEYPEGMAVSAILKRWGFENIEYNFYERLESTQDEAARFLAKNRFKLFQGRHVVFLALEQSKGRGRFNRSWYSAKGGLWFTIIFSQPVKVEKMPFYNLQVVISIIDFLKQTFGFKPMLKWPNDIVVDGRKLAGILTSARVEIDVVSHLVIGVGINVNNDFPEDLEESSVSLKQIVGRKSNLLELFVNLLPRLVADLENLKHRDTAELVMRANELLWKRNEEALISDFAGRKVKALIKEIGSRGELICEVEGKKEVFFSAEVLSI